MLTHLNEYQTCPDCGNPDIRFETKSKHLNGEWIEIREFICGYNVQYYPWNKEIFIPNNKQCLRSEKYRTQRNQRQQAVCDLRAQIQSLKTDDEFKEILFDIFSRELYWLTD